MSLYIPRTSPQYEYARRVASGEQSWEVERDMCIKARTAKEWRHTLRDLAEQETGVRVSYPVAAVLAMIPPDQRKAIVAILCTRASVDFAPDGR